MASWYLEDVVAAAWANPDAFFIPSEQKRHACQMGDLVRLHFVLKDPGADQPRAERMWVEVSERTEKGGACRYQGVLDNQPAYIGDLDAGATIDFEPKHIARTLLRPDDPDYLPVGEQKAIVSALVLEAGRRACWAYREQPDRPEDSGWRLFHGDESDAYLSDADNIRLCDVYWLVDRDATLFQIFRAEIGCAFERAEEGGDWRAVEDWSPDGT